MREQATIPASLAGGVVTGNPAEPGRTRVVHLTSVHPPGDPRIFLKECRSLSKAGYEVILLMPLPSDRRTGPEVDGVRMEAVPLPRNRLDRMTRTLGQILRRALALRADLYHLHDPELLPVGLALRARGRRVVYDAHENYAHSTLSRHWIPAAIRPGVAAAAGLVEALLGGALSGVVAATPTIAGRFPADRTATVRNYVLSEEFAGAPPIPYQEREQAVAYVGDITPVRGIDEMVRAMGLLPADLPATLLLGGRFTPPALEAEVSRLPGWDRVRFLGWQTRDGVRSILSSARVGLVVLHPTPAYVDALPVKLFEYMLAGIPVIASDFPLWREIITEADCGILVDPLDPRALARAVMDLLHRPEAAERMGRNGRDAVRLRFSWESEARALTGLYESILVR